MNEPIYKVSCIVIGSHWVPLAFFPRPGLRKLRDTHKRFPGVQAFQHQS